MGRHGTECLRTAEIGKRAGIFRDRGTENIINDAIANGLLVKPANEGCVVRCKQENNRGGWELTAHELATRRDDLPQG